MILIFLTPIFLLVNFVDCTITPTEDEIDLEDKKIIVLECKTSPNEQIKNWYKSKVGNTHGISLAELNENRYKVIKENNTLIIEDPRKVADEADFVCSTDSENATIRVRGKPEFASFKSKHHTKDVDSFNIIEGDNLQLICEVVLQESFKHDNITFVWYRKFDNGQDETLQGSNFKISYDEEHDSQYNFHIKKSFLNMDNLKYSDRAVYICEAANGRIKANNTVRVRVKDKLAALYPFLGIVAEVTILCIIIFVYERKRSKSDADDLSMPQKPNLLDKNS